MRKTKILLSILLIISIMGCKKTDEFIKPKVTTNEITSIKINSASSGGIIENIDNIQILEVGVCWDTISLPTIASNKTVDSVQNGQRFEFKSDLENLNDSKEYYVRAYAKTNDEVVYGNQLKFSTISLDSLIENPIIEFNDNVLEQRIRLAVNKPTGPITKLVAASVTKLDLSRESSDTSYIKNVDALQYFTSLKELSLFGNKVFDLTPLSELSKLEILNLYNNEVVSLLPLEKLVELRELNLWSNNVEDIQPLSKLTKMQVLNIGANKIKDISPIKGITSINDLWLNMNAYTVDTTTIMSLKNLQTLGVTDCKLYSINFAKDLTKLVDLLFENNYITDISALKNYSNLRTFLCGGNAIKDFRVLEDLYNNGCFKLAVRFTYHVSIINNKADLNSNTENRRIIDLLRNNAVKINWQTGNTQ